MIAPVVLIWVVAAFAKAEMDGATRLGAILLVALYFPVLLAIGGVVVLAQWALDRRRRRRTS